MASFRDFWANQSQNDPTCKLLRATEEEVLAQVSCTRCQDLLDFFLQNLNFLDHKMKPAGAPLASHEVIKVYRKGSHYSIKEGELFALINRPLPPAASSSLIAGPSHPLEHEYSGGVEFQVCPPILFNGEDLLRMEKEGTLGTHWESGPAGSFSPPPSLADASAQAAHAKKASKKKKKGLQSSTSPPPLALVVSHAAEKDARPYCSYCSSMIALRFTNMVTFPRPPDIFSLLLNRSETIGTVRAIMHRIVQDRVKHASELVLLHKNKALADDAKTLDSMGLVENNMVLVSTAAPLPQPAPAQTSATTGGGRFPAMPLAMLNEFDELCFGSHKPASAATPTMTAPQSNRTMASPRKRPALIDELMWARGVEIATRAAARVARAKIELAWQNERVARHNEQLLMDELLAEESKKDAAERKKQKQKEKREQQRREQVELEDQKRKEQQLEEQRRREQQLELQRRREELELQLQREKALKQKEEAERADKERRVLQLQLQREAEAEAKTKAKAKELELERQTTEAANKKKKKKKAPGTVRDAQPANVQPLLPLSSITKPKPAAVLPAFNPAEPLAPGGLTPEFLLASSVEFDPPAVGPKSSSLPLPRFSPALLPPVPTPLTPISPPLPAAPSLAPQHPQHLSRGLCATCKSYLVEGARFCARCGAATLDAKAPTGGGGSRLSFFASLREGSG